MRFTGVGVLLAFLVGHAPTASCAPIGHPTGCPSQANLHQEQPKGEKSVTTFFGKIVKDGDKFVLSDEKRKIWYELDDQETVAKFDGKMVKVTGTLDATKNLILVQSIDQASN